MKILEFVDDDDPTHLAEGADEHCQIPKSTGERINQIPRQPAGIFHRVAKCLDDTSFVAVRHLDIERLQIWALQKRALDQRGLADPSASGDGAKEPASRLQNAFYLRLLGRSAVESPKLFLPHRHGRSIIFIMLSAKGV